LKAILLYLHSLTSVFAETYDPPVVFEKLELIWDLASLIPLMNSKIKYFQVPHVTKFKRYPITAKCHMQYKIFSDRDLMPPLPKNASGESRDVDEIQLEPHIHVGGMKKFYDACVGEYRPYNMSDLQDKKLEGYRHLMKKGVFDLLQERIISSDIQRATADEFQDTFSRTDVQGPSTKKAKDKEREMEDEGGLILWWKGHSFETLSTLKVCFVVLPL
jgi:hypothetical protein